MRRAVSVVVFLAVTSAGLPALASVSASPATVGVPLPGAAGAQPELATEGEHDHEDAVTHDPAQEAALLQRTRQATAVARPALRAAEGPPQQVGSWGPLEDWPVVAVHTALLPDGKVLAFDSVGDHASESYPVHDHTRATVWDPVTGSHTPVDLTDGYNVFCSGLAHLADGRVFVAGGNKDAQLDGIVQTHVFDALTGSWTKTADMAFERWYPTVTPLANREMLITGGGANTPEVRDADGGLRTLTTAGLRLPLYPWLDVAPDGRTFYSGPDNRMFALDTTGTGGWQALGAGDGLRSYGSRALYDIGKLLVAGGGRSRADAAVIDITAPTPRRAATSPMAAGRRQHDLTVLADGSVLATGGNSSGASLVDLAAGVYAAERWDPATGQWTTLAAEQQTRQYHSTALLLPDGRVLSAGGGVCLTCDAVGYLAKDAQVFSPPYLFDSTGAPAVRPVITTASAVAPYGSPFTVSTPDASRIRKVAAVRLSGVTHSNNMEQRYVPMAFTAAEDGTLTVTGPANANVAPPGVYMLFVVDDAGVPSVASMISVEPGPDSPNAAPNVSVTWPRTGSTVAHRFLTLKAAASDSDGTVAKVEFFRKDGLVELGEVTAPPYQLRWRPGYGTQVLRARVTDDDGAVTMSEPVTFTVPK